MSAIFSSFLRPIRPTFHQPTPLYLGHLCKLQAGTLEKLCQKKEVTKETVHLPPVISDSSP